MGKVVAQAIMSLDGYVAKHDNTIGRLFDWLQNGEVEIPTPAGDFAVHLTPSSSQHWRSSVSSIGALICGRTLFDVAEGWHDPHTLDVPVVVVTHRVPTDWVDAHPKAPCKLAADDLLVGNVSVCNSARSGHRSGVPSDALTFDKLKSTPVR